MVVKKIIERNKNRPGVTNVSKNGVHYSWDWGRVHFVNLGVIVGQVDDVMRKRRYGTLGSLDFLIADLKEKVGTSGRPVVITHHVDMLRYSQPLPVDDKKAESNGVGPCRREGLLRRLRATTLRGSFMDTLMPAPSTVGTVPPRPRRKDFRFNVSKSSHLTRRRRFYIEVRNDTVLCREYQTKDGWETGSWAAQTWSAPIARVEKLPRKQRAAHEVIAPQGR